MQGLSAQTKFTEPKRLMTHLGGPGLLLQSTDWHDNAHPPVHSASAGLTALLAVDHWATSPESPVRVNEPLMPGRQHAGPGPPMPLTARAKLLGQPSRPLGHSLHGQQPSQPVTRFPVAGLSRRWPEGVFFRLQAIALSAADGFAVALSAAKGLFCRGADEPSTLR
jgi:hypothetical protein